MKTLWSGKEVTFLIAQRSRGVSAAAIAKELGRSLAAVNGKALELTATGQIEKIPLHLSNNRISHIIEGNLPEELSYDGELHLTGDFISVSDVHVPYWNRDLFDRLFKIATKFKIKRLIINGDFLNGDAFSRWPTGNKGADYQEREFTAAEFVLAKCLNTFKEIVYTMGNHEERFKKALMCQVQEGRLFGMLKTQISTESHPNPKAKIRLSSYPYCIVDEKWFVCHPSVFSQLGGKVPSEIADIEQMNVIAGHNHQFGIQCSRSGKYIGIDQGMACDGSKVEYYKMSVNTYKKWQNGFTMVKNGFPYVFNLKFTDWNYWLK